MFNLKNATVLTRAQQKNVKGGHVCAYSTSIYGKLNCVYGGAGAAEFMATEDGYWSCNTAEAYKACGH